MEELKTQLKDMKETDTAFDAVVAVSLRTLFCLLIAVALLSSYFFIRFPFHAMRTSDRFGFRGMALVQAERAVHSRRITGAANLEALVLGIDLSDSFLSGAGSERARTRYAGKLEFFTREYAADPAFDAQNQIFDLFYFEALRTQGLTGWQRIQFVWFYCFRDYVYTQNARARAALGTADYWLFDGLAVDSEYLKSRIPYLGLEELAIIYNQAAAVKQECDKWGDAGLSQLFKAALKDSVAGFLEDVQDERGEDALIGRQGIRYLHLLYSVHNLESAFDFDIEFNGIKGGLWTYIYSQLFVLRV